MKTFLVSLLSSFLLVSPVAAHEVFCSDSASVYANLEQNFNQRRAYVGLLPEGIGVMEIWKNDEDSSFVAIATFANGQSCLMMSGTELQEVPVEGNL